MKLFESNLNISNSIRSLYNETSRQFLKVRQAIIEIWNRVNGNIKPVGTESFVSHIKDYEFNTVKPQNIIHFDLQNETPEADFDIIKREFDSLNIRNAIDNQESAFFEDDFVSTSDWGNEAMKEQEALVSHITPIIEEADIQEKQFASQIHDELNNAKEKLEEIEKLGAEQILREKESFNDLLINLKREEQQDLRAQLTSLEEEFDISRQRVFDFKSLVENLADEYMNAISQTNEKFGFQSNSLSTSTKKLIKQRKKFASSTAKESLERLNKDFKINMIKIHEEINSKYEEKQRAATEAFEKNLESIQENLLTEKQQISEFSDEKINSIKSEIQTVRKDLVKELSTPNSHVSLLISNKDDTNLYLKTDNENEETDIYFDAVEENNIITDFIEQPSISLEDTSQEKETIETDSIMTTITKTYNLIWENLSGSLLRPYSFHF
ncbi:MAG: hypothetical protein ACRCSV_00185 [Chlamydiales bacterium]